MGLDSDAAGDPPLERPDLDHDLPAVGELRADDLSEVPGPEHHPGHALAERASAPVGYDRVA